MGKLVTMSPTHPPKDPAGPEALEEIVEVARRNSPAIVKGVLVTTRHAKTVMRVYLALGTAEKIEFLKLPVAELIACSMVTIDRAKKRAANRGSFLALLSRR